MEARQLPSKQTLSEYLELYTKHRLTPQSLTKQLSESAKYSVELVASLWTGNKPVSDRLAEIVADVDSKILAAVTLDNFYDLLILLRKNAEEAQSLKWNKDNSMLCVTLHAMANIIITDLQKHPAFQDKINKLKDNVTQFKKNIIDYTHDPIKNGLGVPEEEKRLYKCLWELTVLGEFEFYKEARRFNVYYASSDYNPTEKQIKPSDKYPLPIKLPCTEDIVAFKKNELYANYAAPLVLQKDFGKHFYFETYQSSTRIDFDRFCQNAISKEVKAQPEKTLESQNSTQPASNSEKAADGNQTPNKGTSTPTHPADDIPPDGKQDGNATQKNETPDSRTSTTTPTSTATSITTASMFKDQDNNKDKKTKKLKTTDRVVDTTADSSSSYKRT